MINNKKGKVINHTFVSNFIEKCVLDGKSSSNDICDLALLKIDQIDRELARIQKLKNKRSNLLDVVLSFEIEKKSKDFEKRYVKYIELFDNDIFKFLMNNLVDNEYVHFSTLKNKFYVNDLRLILNELNKNSIIEYNEKITKGKFFQECLNIYMDNVSE